MDRRQGRVGDPKTVQSEQMIERSHRVVNKVLVVNLIERALLDHRRQVDELGDDDAVGVEQFLDAGKGRVQFLEVEEHAGAVNDTRLTVLLTQSACGVEIEELVDGRQTLATRDLGLKCRRLDVQHLDAALADRDEERAVIAADVEHVIAVAEWHPRQDLFAHGVEVLAELASGPGNVAVVDEHDLLRHCVPDLRHRADRAEREHERVAHAFAPFLDPDEVVAPRLIAQVEHRNRPAGAAAPAGRRSSRSSRHS